MLCQTTEMVAPSTELLTDYDACDAIMLNMFKPYQAEFNSDVKMCEGELAKM